MITLFIKYVVRHIAYVIALVFVILLAALVAVSTEIADPVTVMIITNIAITMGSMVLSYFAFKNTLLKNHINV